MKALILAAGQGSRLENLTKLKPKGLLHVAGNPLLGRILRGLKKAGVQETWIVVGYKANMIREQIGARVGTFAVQIAKSYGAEVTAVCSTMKLDMARSIGADHVIDYTQEDFTKNGQRYDLILDVAAHHSIFDFKRALSPKGIYVCIGVAEALRYLEEGHARGKVVITVEHNNKT